jgi:hypothetical protein
VGAIRDDFGRRLSEQEIPVVTLWGSEISDEVNLPGKVPDVLVIDRLLHGLRWHRLS